MKRNEQQTRLELIDPKLRRAGWKINYKKQAIEPGAVCIETEVQGMPNPSGIGYVDYVAFGDDGKPLAVIEAKKSVIDEQQGRVQACLYADLLEKKYKRRPLIYYTNGYSIHLIDGVYPDRKVFGFHTKDEMEHLIQKRGIKIADKRVNQSICNRPYQNDAIAEVIKHLEFQHTRSLIVLATGTGKTRVSCGLSDIFIRNNFTKRILFLADRTNLVLQAKEETYERFLSKIPMATIIGGKKDGAEDARIVFATYQSMLSIIKNIETCPFGIGHFDLIIIDEAHRSVFNKYAEIFDYFDSLMIGLTATPREDEHKSTYRVFNLDNDEPNFEYDIIRAVRDGFLVYYRALDRTPKILKDGVTYASLSEEEREEYIENFSEEDGTIPEKVDGKKFQSVITNEDTIKAVLRSLMEEGLRVNNGDVLGKTIIFARDHNHAVKIQEIFKQMYPEKCNLTGKNGVDYCVVIDNQIKYNDVLQREFKTKQDIRIVVSVNMMETGVDIPECVNLVMFRRVMSPITFWQMIGRGTRRCENLNVMSPSSAYFNRETNDGTRTLQKDKAGFLIFDACNVFGFFNAEIDEEDQQAKAAADNPLSLTQRLFFEKVRLFKAMQSKYASLTTEDKNMYRDLHDEFVDTVKSLNRNYIGVVSNLEYVEKYEDPANWLNFSTQKLNEVKKHICPLIEGEIELPASKYFDMMCYRFSSSKLFQNKEQENSYQFLSDVSGLLEMRYHIADIARHKTSIESIPTDKFLQNSTPSDVDKLRIELRDLMRYIERDIMNPIITHFRDTIDSTDDVYETPVSFSLTVDDFKTLDEKILFYVQQESKNVLVYNLRNMLPITEDMVDEFITDVKQFDRKNEFDTMFPEKDDLVKFLRENIGFDDAAVAAFLDEYRTKGYDDAQIEYLDMLLSYISTNGRFDRRALFNVPALQFQNIFDSNQMLPLCADLDNRFQIHT